MTPLISSDQSTGNDLENPTAQSNLPTPCLQVTHEAEAEANQSMFDEQEKNNDRTGKIRSAGLPDLRKREANTMRRVHVVINTANGQSSPFLVQHWGEMDTELIIARWSKREISTMF